MKISQNGLNLIVSFEGFKSKPYLDSVNVPTIGFGTILYPNGKTVTMSDPEITRDQAIQFLEWEINQKAAGVARYVTASLNQNQIDALISLSYNIGLGAFSRSTLLKLLNSGDVSGAADQFLVWNKAGGKPIEGLTRRREAERSLFLQPMPATDAPDSDADQKLANVDKDLG